MCEIKLTEGQSLFNTYRITLISAVSGTTKARAVTKANSESREAARSTTTAGCANETPQRSPGQSPLFLLAIFLAGRTAWRVTL
jgi:hypothetical protein